MDAVIEITQHGARVTYMRWSTARRSLAPHARSPAMQQVKSPGKVESRWRLPRAGVRISSE
jgi:hypothetical protein